MIDARLTTSKVKYLLCTLIISLSYFMPHQCLAESFWYAGGSLGYTAYDSQNLEADLADRQVPGSSTLDDNKIPWHVFVGYQHNRYLGLEFGYQYLDRQHGSTVLVSQPSVSAETSRETDGFMLGLNAVLPIKNRYAIQLTGGVYLWHVVTAVNSLSGGGAIAINFDDRSSGIYTGLKLQYALTKNTSFDVQWLEISVEDDVARLLNLGFTHRFLTISD